MKRNLLFAALFLLPLLSIACSEDRVVAPVSGGNTPALVTADPAGMARAILARTGWPEEPGSYPLPANAAVGSPVQTSCIASNDRQVITGDIVHYKYRLRVGCGPYDVIGLHRVVRERRPNQPARTNSSVFLIHGDWKDFEGCFLPGVNSPGIPMTHSFAVFLAQRDIDVWGIDQAWALVPEEVTDFSFMAGWGMDQHVKWAGTAVEVARIVRALTGNGYQKMNLLGYSGGSPIGLALINNEAVLPPAQRKINGFIGVDQGALTSDPAWGEAMCAFSGSYQALIDAGQYQDNIVFRYLGIPAIQAPDDPSAVFPGLTNIQAALAFGATPLIPGFPCHFLAGVFPDPAGLPTGLRYTNVDYFLEFMATAPFYEAAVYERDEYKWTCPSGGDVPWDDHFAQVRVPVLYVMAGGGFGAFWQHTLDALGSCDKTRLRVSLDPSNPLVDFGHIDLFLADAAPQVFWSPAAKWILRHSDGQGGVIAVKSED